MSDTLITVIAIALAAVLMFVFPLMTMSDRTDDVAQLTVEVATTEFVDRVRSTGKITGSNYDKFLETITSTGNTYNIDIDIKVLDENPSKKITANTPTQKGEKVFVTYYTSQIVQQLDEKGTLFLKEGDQVHVSITNTNTTLSQLLSLPTSNDISTIMAETTQTCTVNGI